MHSIDKQLAERWNMIRAYQGFTLDKASPTSERQFAFFEANLSNCFPRYEGRKCLELFRQLQLNRRLSFHDMELMLHPELLHITGWNPDWAASLRQDPALVCTYHIGSYRLLNLLLARAGVPISLLVSGQSLRYEQQQMADLYPRLAIANGLPLDIQLIDAERPQALLKMARAARSGRTLLAYIDGNTGTQTPAVKNEHLHEIDFGNQRMRARIGLASLAHRLGMPIRPVYCEREGMDLAGSRKLLVHYLPQIPPEKYLEAEQFAREATGQLYQHLLNCIRQKPQQWEGWLSLHRHLTAPEEVSKWLEDILVQQCALYRHNGRPYLMHKPSYRHYLLTWTTYERLKKQKNSFF